MGVILSGHRNNNKPEQSSSKESRLLAAKPNNRSITWFSQFKQFGLYLLSPENQSVVNAPNASTFLGGLLVMFGASNIDNIKGVIGIGAGRFLDVFDGMLARKLQQESEIGKTLDHTMDKIAMGAILYNAWKKDVGAKPALAAIAILNTVNAGITLEAKIKHPDLDLHPTKSGKHSIAGQGLAIGAYMLENLSQDPATANRYRWLGHALTSASLALGVHSSVQYTKWLTAENEQMP